MTCENKFTVRIESEGGLHARPAGMIAKTASQFKSTIMISAHGENKNAKSIMNIMAMGLKKDEEVCFTASGDDAVPALSAISELFNKHFQIQ
ncbi:MAG: HPr family phosphocarrier protein [Bdellovibrionaceae bacterium]|nr:HPr family phosphocarrier protein [Pseudobdellovibrionaceae bacterium]